MKVKIIISMFLIFLLSGFQEKDTPPSISGTWILKCYINAISGDTLIKPDINYTFNSKVEFTFYDHQDTGVILGNTYENKMFGNYILAYPDKIDLNISGTDKREYSAFSSNFRNCMNILSRYEIDNNRLKLFYNKNNSYMLLEKKM